MHIEVEVGVGHQETAIERMEICDDEVNVVDIVLFDHLCNRVTHSAVVIIAGIVVVHLIVVIS